MQLAFIHNRGARAVTSTRKALTRKRACPHRKKMHAQKDRLVRAKGKGKPGNPRIESRGSWTHPARRSDISGRRVTGPKGKYKKPKKQKWEEERREGGAGGGGMLSPKRKMQPTRSSDSIFGMEPERGGGPLDYK